MTNKALRSMIADPQHFQRLRLEHNFNREGYYGITSDRLAQICSQASEPNMTPTPAAPNETRLSHSLRVSKVMAASEMAI
jgi:hypothetical protein